MKLVPREGYSLGPEVSFGVSALIQCSIWHNLSGNRNAAKRGSAYKEIDIQQSFLICRPLHVLVEPKHVFQKSRIDD